MFTALLLATSHNYGGQGPVEAPPAYDLEQATPDANQLPLDQFAQRQQTLNNLPKITVDYRLEMRIERYQNATKTVNLSSFIIPVCLFVGAAAFFRETEFFADPSLFLKSLIIGALSGVPCEIARRHAAQKELQRLSRLDPNQDLTIKSQAVLEFPHLKELVYPYFYNNNPDGLCTMLDCFTSSYASSTNPYPLLTASSEMESLIGILRILQKTLEQITTDRLIITSQVRPTMLERRLQKINTDLTNDFMDPLTANYRRLYESELHQRQMNQKFHTAVIASLARGN
ncbi:hypothetical protein EBU95_10940 [bacterium]|nr:hypothetical protein [bacterium]